MKRSVLLLALVFVLSGHAQSPADRRADSLLRNEAWFELDRMLSESTVLSPGVRLRAQAMSDARFRRFDTSNEAILALLADPQTDPEWQGALAGQLLSNYRMARDHAAAAALYDQLRQRDSDPADDAEEDPARTFFASQAAQAPTRLDRPEGGVEIPFRVEQAGRGAMIVVDVQIGGRTEPFVLDTGCAEMSFTSETFAREHGIRPIGCDLDLSGVGGRARGWLGIADSLRVGPMVLRNTLFVVSPTPPSDSVREVNAVLGNNFLVEAETVEVLGRERTLRFPPRDTLPPTGAPNMFMKENGLFYLRSAVNGHPALLLLDSGNTKSTLSSIYLDKHREEIEATCEKREFTTGGIGGMLRDRAYVMPTVEIRIGAGKCTLYDTEIVCNPETTAGTGEDGSLGVDFLLACDRVRIDYRAMRITLVNGEMPEMLRTVCLPAQSLPACDRPATELWQSKNRRAAVRINVQPATR